MAVAKLQDAGPFEQCCKQRALTDLSRREPRSFWNKVPDSSSLNSARGRFRSSWKKNCASWNLALSTASLPVCTTHAHTHSHLSWNLSVGRKNGVLSRVRSNMQSTGFWQCVLWHQTRQVKRFAHVLELCRCQIPHAQRRFGCLAMHIAAIVLNIRSLGSNLVAWLPTGIDMWLLA